MLFQKSFTGEIPPLLINKDTANNLDGQTITEQLLQYKELSIVKWRDIARLHLPSDADVSSAEYDLRLEYFEIDYNLPSLTPVPSSQLPLVKLRESITESQARTLDFKNKYNRHSGHGVEIRLIRKYDPSYKLNLDNFNNSIPSHDINVGYPIAELLYNNKVTGFLDLMVYLTKSNTVIFGDIRQQIDLQIIPNLGDQDSILVRGGYSGSVVYKLKSNLVITKSNTETATSTPLEILPLNPNRKAFYLSNNGANDIYFNFGAIANLNLKLNLKPKATLIYEDGRLFIEGTEQNLTLDSRYKLGLSLWVRSASGVSELSIEELSVI